MTVDWKKDLKELYSPSAKTPAAKTAMGEQPKQQWRVGGLGMSHPIRNFEPLRYVPAELESIVRRDTADTDGVLPGVIYLDDAFSRGAFESVLREGYPVIHIASHFELKPGTKKSSYLLLGDGTMLSLAEIKDRNYDFSGVDMLTLSACNTAVGTSQDNGSEVESFGALAQHQAQIISADGTEPAQAWQAIQEAVSHVRSGAGACLLQMRVVRLAGHTFIDDQAYKSAETRAEEAERDPVKRLCAYHASPLLSLPPSLDGECGAKAAELCECLVEEVRIEIAEALHAAEAEPEPDRRKDRRAPREPRDQRARDGRDGQHDQKPDREPHGAEKPPE